MRTTPRVVAGREKERGRNLSMVWGLEPTISSRIGSVFRRLTYSAYYPPYMPNQADIDLSTVV